jgi:transcriptional repressor NrdR
MICPDCGYNDSKVIDSRPAESKVRRRRECLNEKCTARFTTYETIEDLPVMVVKKDNTIEPFDCRKLTDRVLRATVKRPVKLKTVESMVESIQVHFKNNLQREVTSDKIGELVLRRLKDIDHVAYVRFASVYREFNDIDSFVKIISELQSEEV